MSDRDYKPMEPADLEEIARGLRDFARSTKAQFDALVEVGFTESQALYLSAAFIRANLSNDR